jgi:NADPH-dependent F420 reductase
LESYNQKIQLEHPNYSLFIKREDKIHPHVSGNKFRKLKYNLLQAKKDKKETLLTFGGAFSNHILAVAAAGSEHGFKTIGIIRGEELRDKIVITMANALVKVGKEFQPLVPPRGSIAAHVQAEIPHSRVVAAMQHLPAKELGNLDHKVDSDVLICSDFPEAIEVVSDLVQQIPGCRPLNTGRLSNALALEAFTAVLLQLNVRYKTRVAPRLTGIPDIDPISGRKTTISE